MGLGQTMLPGMRASSKRCWFMLAEPHGDEAVGGKIGQKPSGRAGGAKQGFSGKIAAADGAFHRGGPASCRPISRKEQARDGRLLRGAPAIDSWRGRKCRG